MITKAIKNGLTDEILKQMYEERRQRKYEKFIWCKEKCF